VDELDGIGVVLLDTRKTTPGWRRLEKYAVRTGGGTNHRFDLSDAIMLKDNHSWILRKTGASTLADWVSTLAGASPAAFLQVEVDSREEYIEALEVSGIDSILLDNFSPGDLAWAVEEKRGRDSTVLLEASGGISLENARLIAETGVDRMSVGALTHSAPALDVSLELSEVFILEQEK
jgi:nicotinate-nucleotide pyrophosphorylase (carboxylating)